MPGSPAPLRCCSPSPARRLIAAVVAQLVSLGGQACLQACLSQIVPLVPQQTNASHQQPVTPQCQGQAFLLPVFCGSNSVRKLNGSDFCSSESPIASPSSQSSTSSSVATLAHFSMMMVIVVNVNSLASTGPTQVSKRVAPRGTQGRLQEGLQ